MTLINHAYRYIFVHIPKNAGTSVAQALMPLSGYRDLEIGGTDLGEAIAPHFRRRYGVRKHSPLRDILTHLGDPALAEYHVFCVCRHPIARTISSFAFLRRWRAWESLDDYREHAAEFATCRTLDEFVRSAFFESPGPDRLFMPQHDWLVTADGAPLRVDRVLRLESLEDDLVAFLREIGVPRAALNGLTLPKANSSPWPSDAGDLSSDSLELLRDRYAIDFERFGYRLQGPE